MSEDPAELCQHHFVDLSNTAWARKDLQSKQSKANVVVTNTTATTNTVTSSHTLLGSVTSIGPHKVICKTEGKRLIMACSIMVLWVGDMETALKTELSGISRRPSDSTKSRPNWLSRICNVDLFGYCFVHDFNCCWQFSIDVDIIPRCTPRYMFYWCLRKLAYGFP